MCMCVVYYTRSSRFYVYFVGYKGHKMSLYSVHCTLYTVHYTLYTIHCTMYSVKYNYNKAFLKTTLCVSVCECMCVCVHVRMCVYVYICV